MNDINTKRMLRELLPNSGLHYSRYFFKQREGIKFIVNKHHPIVSDTLQKVLDGKIKRLIVNVPPGYTKTEEAVINFITRGLSINPKARFIHLSYANELASLNSQTCREVVESEEYQELFDVSVKHDTSAKKRWQTTKGGGVYATSAGGQVTGFRAGRINSPIFSGAIIIDDPIKPEDVHSDTKRKTINTRYNSTIASRLAVEDIPVILIMQRVHEEDLSGYLLKGGSGEKWHHLVLPVEIPENKIEDWYPYNEYKYGIPIIYDLPSGPLWELKHTQKDIDRMRNTDPYTCSSQYDQRPAPKGGSIFKDKWWKIYTELPQDISFMRLYGDTAQEVNQHNDYSVFQVWAYSPSKGIFLIDQVRDKWESPELKTNFIAFWNKHAAFDKSKSYILQKAMVEKKSSGSGLIQTIRNEESIPIEGIDRSRGKVARAYDVVPQIAVGNVWLPAKADFLFDYLDEFRKFTPLMTHKNDDQIDPTMDAIQDILIDKNLMYTEEALS